MKTITSVSVCKNNKSRSNVYLNDAFYCSLDNLIVVKYGLKAGVEISEEKLLEIQQENEFSTAFDLALNYITRYKRTKKQIIEYLMKKGYLYPLCVKVVQKLESYGFADDSDFAKSYAKQNSKSKGKMFIKMQLRAKGVDEKTADLALNEIQDETPVAIEIAKKYMKNKEPDQKTLLKCYRHILSKGFSFESASAAIKAVRGDADDY